MLLLADQLIIIESYLICHYVLSQNYECPNISVQYKSRMRMCIITFSKQFSQKHHSPIEAVVIVAEFRVENGLHLRASTTLTAR